ncbi:MAG: hypothetical protein P4N60_15880 [Verrucomicrobiae bacterium]|nr:hypothetical protein [Verrucomicrobiae bacterium]
MKSMSLLGLHEHAQAFFTCLSEIYADNNFKIGKRTFRFWCETIHYPR